MPEQRFVRHEALRDLATRIQMGFSIPREHAEIVTDCLVEAELMGLTTHGIIRLKWYMDRMHAGGINPHPTMRRLRDHPATALLDGDNGLGPVGGRMAMQLAIEKAATYGVGLVLMRNCNHYGVAQYYSRMALPHDMIGVSMTNVIAAMPPTGGAEARQGNNPFSIAIGASQEPPVVVDGATSKGTWGRLFLAIQRGEKLPEGLYVDRDGNATIDPQAVLDGGCLLPIAEHKGYGLAVAIELLTGMLAAGALDHEVPHPYKILDKPGDNTYLMAAIRIDHFCEPADFYARMDEWIRFMRATRKAPGVKRVWLPGEMEHVTREARLAAGIPLHAAEIAELDGLAKEAGVPGLGG
jgi:LDH2 family malate/lactate/ureidoglycolate dehydrogenase